MKERLDLCEFFVCCVFFFGGAVLKGGRRELHGDLHQSVTGHFGDHSITKVLEVLLPLLHVWGQTLGL